MEPDDAHEDYAGDIVYIERGGSNTPVPVDCDDDRIKEGGGDHNTPSDPGPTTNTATDCLDSPRLLFYLTLSSLLLWLVGIILVILALINLRNYHDG